MHRPPPAQLQAASCRGRLPARSRPAAARGSRPTAAAAAAAGAEVPPELPERGQRAAAEEVPKEEAWDYVAPPELLARNRVWADAALRGRTLLAPLTKGGNLPFRRLCVDFDAELRTMSEMAFARKLVKGDRVENARMYRAPNELCFGVQIATNSIAEGLAASRAAARAGASWIDLNCGAGAMAGARPGQAQRRRPRPTAAPGRRAARAGMAGCPIFEATRRGLGAALLRKPTKLARLVAGIAAGSELPVTVKIRTGESDRKVNAPRVVALLEQAGAAAVTVHGRTMEQRYKKAADWALIASLAAAHPGLALLGNGDLLTHYEADARRRSGVAGLMVGRGALIKPWIFEELREGRELLLTAAERVGVYRRLAGHMKAHFGDDAWGKRKAFYFFPWHFAFFSRYRPLPAEVYAADAARHPLIATRSDLADPRVGESEAELPLLERLLRCEAEAAHGPIAEAIWDAASDADAVTALEALAASSLAGWEEELRAGGRDGSGRDDDAAVEG
ncbi:DUS3L [Scenedesmus sp. PABB004]|nr:DUS3L [Scenedesmus sp. PABB004]